MRFFFALFVTLCVPFYASAQSNGSDSIPTFPAAVGGGADALQECRHLGIKVHKQSTFLQNGGSSPAEILQDSMSSSRLDIVLADTSTRDFWGSYSPNGNSSANCVIYAGQTDQGSGMVMTAPSFTSSWTLVTMRADTSFVLSHAYVRSMNDDGTGATQGVNIRLTSGSKFVMWQSSTAGGDDKEIAVTDVQNGSILNTLLRGHHTTTTTCFNTQSTSDNFTVYRNAWIRCKKRVPRLNTQNIANDWQFINWLAYEWKGDSRQLPTHPSDSITRVDFVSSRMKPGPGTDAGKMARNVSGEWHNSYSANGGHPQVYDKDFIHGGASTTTAYTSNPVSNVPNDVEWTVDSSGVAVKDSFFVTSPVAQITTNYPVRDTAAASAMIAMVDSIGRVTRLDCSGRWEWMGQDYIDAAAATGAKDSTSVADFGATFPADSLSPAAPCADADGDGLPNSFETLVGGDNTSTAADSITTSGYLMIEHYLWGIQAPNFLAPNDTVLYVDSSFVAIKRDCGNPFGACVPAGAASSNPAPQFAYYLQVIAACIALLALTGAGWRLGTMQDARRIAKAEVEANKALYAATQVYAPDVHDLEAMLQEVKRDRG